MEDIQVALLMEGVVLGLTGIALLWKAPKLTALGAIWFVVGWSLAALAIVVAV